MKLTCVGNVTWLRNEECGPLIEMTGQYRSRQAQSDLMGLDLCTTYPSVVSSNNTYNHPLCLPRTSLSSQMRQVVMDVKLSVAPAMLIPAECPVVSLIMDSCSQHVGLWFALLEASVYYASSE